MIFRCFLFFFFSGLVFSVESPQQPQKENKIKPTVNMLWVNSQASEKLIPATIENNTLDPYDRIQEWINLGYKVNLYYNSAFLSNLNAALSGAKNRIKSNDVEFLDIRNLTHITKNKNLFSEQYPLYFRVDLLKMIITYETLSLKNNPDPIAKNL